MNTPQKLRILVIDDDPTIATLFKKMLSGLGHHILTFPDPTACSVYKNHDCECPQKFPCADVVIADIMMPNMNGIEFFKLLRKRGCKALDANKALMSAGVKPEQMQDIQDLGCHFIKKPFRIFDIVNWLDECATRIPEDRVLAELG